MKYSTKVSDAVHILAFIVLNPKGSLSSESIGGSKEGSSEGSKVLGPIPTDKMTYRSFPGLGSDKVSILGYGCCLLYTSYMSHNPQIRYHLLLEQYLPEFHVLPAH